MRISTRDWNKYINKLSAISKKAADEMTKYIQLNGFSNTKALIDYAYALATKYGEGTASLSCLMYDAIAEMQKVSVPSAVPAATATYEETAKAINGCLKQSSSGQLLSQVTQRLVKQAGADTTLQNAQRDQAYYAWISSGDSCPYCLMISSMGWQRATRETANGSHADHIHANCDCQFCVDFKGNMNVSGYDPDEIASEILDETGEYDQYIFYRGNGRKSIKGNREALNKMRRLRYKENADEINKQKREAYALRKENQET